MYIRQNLNENSVVSSSQNQIFKNEFRQNIEGDNRKVHYF